MVAVTPTRNGIDAKTVMSVIVVVFQVLLFVFGIMVRDDIAIVRAAAVANEARIRSLERIADAGEPKIRAAIADRDAATAKEVKEILSQIVDLRLALARLERGQ